MNVCFTFDFISPYAYFAWLEIQALCARTEAELTCRPVLFAGLLNHWEHKGPAEIPAKRLFTVKQTARRAARLGVPFHWPAKHPFNPITALRCAQVEVAGEAQHAVIDALFAAIWGRGIDGQDPEALAAALTEAGLDGPALIARTKEKPVKQALIRAGEQAIAEGLWGVPTMQVDGGELFWGHDALPDLEAFLRGEDPVDSEALEQLAASIPAGARR